MVGVAKRFTLPGIFSCFCASSLDNIDGSSQPISAPQGRRSIHFSNSAGGSFTGGRGRPPSTSTSRAPAQEGQPSSYALGSSTTSSLASAEGRSSIGLARAESMLLFSYFEEEASSDPHLSETALFIESMLSDMRARACAVTTLDTASSLTRKCCDMWSVTSSNNMFSAYEPDEHNTIPTGKRLSLDNSDKGPDEDRRQQPPNPCRQGVKGPLNAAMEPSPNFTVESEPVLASAATRLSAGEVGQDVVAGYGLLGAAASSVLSAGPCIPAFAKGVTADQDAFPAACGSIKPNRGKGLFLLAVYSQLPAAVTGKVQPDEPKTWSAAFPAFRRDTNDDDAASATMTHPHDAQDSYEPCQVGAAESDVGAPQGQSHLPRSLEDVRLESAAPGKPTATVALVDAAEREGASLMKIQQQLLLQPGQLAVLLPCPLQMLADLGDLTSLARPGALGGAWLGTWHGNQVVVKLTSYPSADAATAQLLATTRASGVRHPNLLNVYDTRAALVDEQTAASLDPIQATALRSGWTDRCRPMGRLQRFLALNMPPLQTPGSTTDSAPSLTVFPGDVVSATGSICIVADAAPPSPAQRALSALPLHPGGCVVAAITEYCDMGNLLSLSCGSTSPFKPSRSWLLHVAQRALLRTAREVAAAMRALHAQGIVHGALRPSNVLLRRSSADRRGYVAVVADVGSESLQHAAANPLLTVGPCMVLLAPEVMVGDGATAAGAGGGGGGGVGGAGGGASADVYSYGMLLYVMAAGEMPFAGRHLIPTLTAVVSEGLQPEWPMGHHEHLAPLFYRCIARKPEDRPSFKQILFEIRTLEQTLKSAKQQRAK